MPLLIALIGLIKSWKIREPFRFTNIFWDWVITVPSQDKVSKLQDLNEFLEPGMLVQHPSEPDWGVGQVQSRVNGKITINFTEVGKVVVDGAVVALVQVISQK